jgi:exodeoxyribonuclease-3
MKEIKLLCWNVNGVRALVKKGFFPWLQKESPDILCLQETKVSPDNLTKELLEIPGYQTIWNYGERKGYSGVATFTRQPPKQTALTFGAPEFDKEGRVIITTYPEFTLCNVYFPNGKKNAERLKYKMDFYEAFYNYLEPLRKKGEKIIICGDVNTAHQEIDLAHPKENSKISGFLPVERAWLDKLFFHGYMDSFRYFHKEPGQYSWWDMKTGARARDIGWRIDYFIISENLLPHVDKAYILKEVQGSDHCPIGLILKF